MQRAKLLVRFGVGYDKVDLKAASANGIAIARTTGANTTAVAEMALTMMVSARRRINTYQAGAKAGKWVKDIGNEIIGGTAVSDRVWQNCSAVLNAGFWHTTRSRRKR